MNVRLAQAPNELCIVFALRKYIKREASNVNDG